MKNLPETIKLYLRAHYPHGHIEGVQNILSGNAQHYLIHLEKEDVIYHLEFDSHGQFVKESNEKRFDAEYIGEDFIED